MSKTDFNPKVSAIAPRENPASGANGQNSPKIQPIERDVYASSGADPYKALLSGRTKAETAPIQEMLGAGGSSARPSKRNLSGMDMFLEGFLMGDQLERASSADFDKVYVPDIGRIFLDNPGIEKNISSMIGLRDRYENLGVMLEALIANEEALLRDPQLGYFMKEDEIESHSNHLKELQSQHSFNSQQLAKANFHLDWARKTADEAKELAEQEAEWWNPTS